jgi:ABC-type Mn2+/Zn2+ transport system ATPase subunit
MRADAGANATQKLPIILSLCDASFSYGGEAALEGITIDVVQGEAVALLGPNGSGKSTLLKGILGLIERTGGTLSAPSGKGAIGYLPQTENLDPQFPISLEQVVMMGRYRSIGWMSLPRQRDRIAVSQSLDIVGLSDHARARFGELSGGQQQRGFLARAIVSNPQLLLLDEPFNGLDHVNREALIATLSTLKKQGVASLISTHDLQLTTLVCDTVLLLNKTQIAYGPRDKVLTLPNVQAAFRDVGVEMDEHTLVLPDHSGH